MHWPALLAAVAVVPGANALLRFACSQLVIDRLDPLVFPGAGASPHLHQIVGGNAFNITMDPKVHDLPSTATCTSCTFSEDLSNYWTAVLYFRAKNNTFHRVPLKGNANFEAATGGMTVYYTPTVRGSGKVTAFKPGFRMIIGNPTFRTQAEASKYRQLTYTCLATMLTRSGETTSFPKKPCAVGIMVNVRFPTCWDGVNLDSDDHMSHVAYPASGTFESGGACPATHPVTIPQLFYEAVWDTTKFNDQALWPAGGDQPFVWSFGDPSGYGNHGDYVFGWKGDALQKAMDANCASCPNLKTQTIPTGNKCTIQPAVKENVDGWLEQLPGGLPVTTTGTAAVAAMRRHARRARGLPEED